MAKARKTKVGFLGLMLELYDFGFPQLKEKQTAFAHEIVEAMAPFAEVDFPGVCNTRAQVDEAVARFEQAEMDLIMVVFLSYAPSLIALPALLRTQLPVLIFNTQRLYAFTQETDPGALIENHGMHGVQDLANVLVRASRPFHLLTGHWQDEATLAELKRWCDAARTVRFLRGARIGLLGYPMEQMGDFGVDETALLAQVGVEVKHIQMKQVATAAATAPQEEIEQQMVRDRELFDVDPKLTEAEHAASSRLEWALRQVLQEMGLHGFAAHFLAIEADGRLETLPFLAACKLLGEGYSFSGEGDVTCATAVVMLQEMVGEANFTEMFTMDFAGNAILMSHMGEGNWRMACKDRPVRLVRREFEMVHLLTPASLSFALEPGEVTLASLTTVAEGRLKLVVTEGKVLDFAPLKGLTTPHYKFGPEGYLSDFLTRFSTEGGSHHQALAYGHLADTLEKVASLLGIEYARV